MKRELKKLVRLAAQDEEDCSTEIYDEICDKAQALKNYKCCKPQPAAPSKSRSFSEQLDSVPVPDCFQCPISTELMRDPVILASGQVICSGLLLRIRNFDFALCLHTISEDAFLLLICPF